MSLRASLRNTATRFAPAALWKPILRRYYLNSLRKYRRANDWESRETDLAVVRHLVVPGDTVIDLGANFGFYTAYLSGLVGTSGSVLSFEPIPITFEMLSYNVRLLPMSNVRVFNCALSDRSGEAVMTVPRFESGTHNYYQARLSGDAPLGPRTAARIAVQIATLDSTVGNQSATTTFIKVDVEGHELPALRGAAHIIHDQHPALLIEMSGNLDDPTGPGATLITLLRAEGYGIYWYDGNTLSRRAPGDSSINYFFLTDRHLERLTNRIDIRAK